MNEKVEESDEDDDDDNELYRPTRQTVLRCAGGLV